MLKVTLPLKPGSVTLISPKRIVENCTATSTFDGSDCAKTLSLPAIRKTTNMLTANETLFCTKLRLFIKNRKNKTFDGLMTEGQFHGSAPLAASRLNLSVAVGEQIKNLAKLLTDLSQGRALFAGLLGRFGRSSLSSRIASGRGDETRG